MSEHKEEVNISFTGTAILSFVIVFAILLLMTTVHGPYSTQPVKEAAGQIQEK